MKKEKKKSAFKKHLDLLKQSQAELFCHKAVSRREMLIMAVMYLYQSSNGAVQVR